MMKKEKDRIISQEEYHKDLQEEAKRISKWLNKSESPLDDYEFFIFYLLCDLNTNYCSILGLLEEIKLRYREISLKTLEGENEI